MSTLAYINSTFLGFFGPLVLAQGANPKALIERTSIPIQRLSNPDGLIGLTDFAQLLELSAKHFPMADPALQLAKQQDLTILGPLCARLQSCDNISQAIQMVVQHFSVLVSGIRIEVIENADMLQLRYHCDVEDIALSKQFQDYLLATALQTLRELVGHHFPIRACFFTRHEKDEQFISHYIDYFGCPVAFSSSFLAITLDTQILTHPLNERAITITSRINQNIESYGDLVLQVKKMISICLSSGNHDMDTVAQALGFTRRTLQRRLKDKGTRFSALLDSVRCEHADSYISNPQFSLTDISMLLGFQNLSAFSRSYQQWHGYSPSTGRKHNI